MTVTVSAAGDMMPGDSFYCIGHGVRGVAEKEGEEFLFAKVKDALRRFDAVVGNLECILSSLGEKKGNLKSTQYRGTKMFAKALQEHNFSVLTIANNHILQHGQEPMLDTVTNLEAVGIMPIGLPVMQQRTEPDKHIKTIKGINIPFISYCLNEEPTTKSIVPEIEDVFADIKFFDNLADRVIVSLH